MVEYRERCSAIGEIPRTANRREVQRDEEILSGRAIDRALRPLFPAENNVEMQIVCTVHSSDGLYSPVELALNACSAAVHCSGVEWQGPLGAVHLVEDGKKKEEKDTDQVEDNEKEEEEKEEQKGISTQKDQVDTPKETASYRILVAGQDAKNITMIEGESSGISNHDLVGKLRAAGPQMEQLVKTQLDLPRGDLHHAGGGDLNEHTPSDETRSQALQVMGEHATRIAQGSNVTKRDREIAQTKYWLAAQESLGTSTAMQTAVHDVLQDALRDAAIDLGKRPDGRTLDKVREICTEVDLLPSQVHGSGLFSRGNTQVFGTVALGAPSQAQTIHPALGPSIVKRVVLNYSFPPYSVNRTGSVFGSNRRMVGHGNLAEKALLPVLELITEPVNDRLDLHPFPFCVNISCEVMGSDGSSSMASVCSASLALADAGVPIREHVAGVSVGLYSRRDGDDGTEEQFALPVDILGMEDHFGEMDFKIAGTQELVTAFQLDIKRSSISLEVLELALDRAKSARQHILDKMNETAPISEDPSVPIEMHSIPVPTSGLKMLLHKQRSKLKEIERTFGVAVELCLEPSIVYIIGTDPERAAAAKNRVNEIAALAQMKSVLQLQEEQAVMDAMEAENTTFMDP